MLKYKYVSEVFSEIPGEISLAIALTGCQIRCKGCHSRELWEDTGTPLTTHELDRLLDEHSGVSCLLLLGGEHDIESLTFLFQHVFGRIKTAWYCGLDQLPKDKQSILQFLDFLKIGHYDPELGGLATPGTNQVLYSVNHQSTNNELTNITYKLQKQ